MKIGGKGVVIVYGAILSPSLLWAPPASSSLKTTLNFHVNGENHFPDHCWGHKNGTAKRQIHQCKWGGVSPKQTKGKREYLFSWFRQYQGWEKNMFLRSRKKNCHTKVGDCSSPCWCLRLS